MSQNISGAKAIEDVAVEAKVRTQQNVKEGAIVRVDRPRIGGREVRVVTDELPPAFSRKLAYQTAGAQTLEEVVRSVSAVAGVQIRMFEAFEADASSGSGSAAAGAVATSYSKNKVTFQVNGTFRDFLNEVAGLLDISWRYNKQTDAVEFYRFETRTLSVMLPPGQKSIAATINLGASGGGGGGGGGGGSSGGASSGGGSSGSTSGNVSVDHKVTVSPWASIVTGVASILQVQKGAGGGGGAGGTGGAGGAGGAGAESLTAQSRFGSVVANPELGLLTVSARPQFLGRIASYIESINRRFAGNVLIDVKVLDVILDNNASAGFSMDVLAKELGRYSMSIVSSSVLAPSAGTPGRLTLDAINTGGTLGVNLVVEALSQVGRVSLQSQGQVIAINGQPAPFQQAREITYVASSSSTAVPNAGVITTVNPGTRLVGFTANFMPLIMGDNRILLQYQIQNSALLAMREVRSGGNNITQLPEIASQSLQQQAFVRDGQTIMLFGYEQERISDTRNTGLISLSKSTVGQRVLNVVLIQVRTSVADSISQSFPPDLIWDSQQAAFRLLEVNHG
ncbi:MAG TPA: hypothetical protein VN259_05490 [Xanthomonadales bacterium]|nr:hypothetical protein [Xanthomonadales bacterium]